ncbi:hemocin immunity protein [Pasteurella testudinis]|uniref:hemocin immunity protein n=1 Tax=Pasteurella testudinis TaxID=761 RepID=UPI00405978E6
MGKIGPHEGKELELMLNHQKKLALFYTDSDIPHEFLPYIENNTFSVKEISLKNKNNGMNMTYFIIFRAESSTEAEYLASLLAQSFERFIPSLEREIGLALGYTEEDTALYIQNAQSVLQVNPSFSY